MLVSVITVCRNSERTIARALQSVANQDWPRVEHIVIDGASTDSSPSIIKSFHAQLACFISEPDSGIYDAMNKGLGYAKGDIICFLNADDLYANNQVLSRVVALMKESNLDAVFGDVSYYHENNPARLIRRYRSQRFHPDRLAWGWMPAHPALFLSKYVVRRVGYFKSDYRIAGDYDYVLRIFHNHIVNYRHLSEVLVNMQSGGVSTGGWRSKILLNKEVLRACRENGVRTNFLKILSKYPVKLLEFFDK